MAAQLTPDEVSARLAPVILGGDVLAYSYARCLDSAWGVKLTVISNIDVKITSSSRCVDYRIFPEAQQEEKLLSYLQALGTELAAAGKVGLLVGSADWQARFLSHHKAELQEWFHVPYPDPELFDAITQKQVFYELCEKRGVPYPTTWQLDPGGPIPNVDEYPYPLILKPSHSPSWDLLEFEGKRKIYELHNPREFQEAWAAIVASGYEHPIIAQDFVPGGDDAIRSFTALYDAQGNLQLASGGHVVLQDHGLQALGNPVCILSERTQAIIDGAQALLKGLGYSGYANFDVKFDERDGSFRFFEVNARAGRNTFYVTLGGVNFVVPLVEHFVCGKELSYEEAFDPFCYALVPWAVIKHHVESEDVLGQVRELSKQKLMASPLRYPKDSLAHKIWVEAYERRQVSKFNAY